MKINFVELNNFLSFENLKFPFREKGIILIDGKTGSGKTTIFDAIYWAIYGKTSKGLKADEVVNDKYEKNCFVRLEFEDEKHTYEVARYRKHEKFKNEIEFYKDGKKEAFQDVQSAIDDLFNMSYRLFQISNMISNDPSSQILSLTEAKRSDIFEEVFGLSGIEAYEKKVTKEIRNLKGRIENNTTSLIELRTKLKTLRKSLNSFEESKEETKEMIKEHLDSLEEELNNLNKVDIKKIKKKQEELNSHNGTLKKEQDEQDEEEKMLNDLNKQSRKLTNNIDDLKSELKELAKSSECPECGSALKKAKADELKKKREARIDELQTDIDEITESISMLNQNVKERTEKIETLEEKIKKVKKEISSLLPYEDLDIDDLESEKKEVENNYSNWKDKLVDIENDKFIKENEKEIKQVERNIPRREAIERRLKEELNYYDFWKFAFNIKNDNNIKKFRIKTVLKQFNKYVDTYIKMFFNDKSKLYFNENMKERIIINGKNRSYRQLSKGQRKKCDNAVNFAFFMMVRSIVKPLPFIFVDECDDGLDEHSTSLIMELLNSFAKENVVYVISHKGSIRNSVDEAFHVSIEDDISSIEKVF